MTRFSCLFSSNVSGDAPPGTVEKVILEIMFHVAPFLPYSSSKEDKSQQLHKKRHIGNDICVIIFKEGTSKINPDIFKSQVSFFSFIANTNFV